ncbi:hypothetical protein [Leptolyngbya iicbica]|uniref:Uncharacterized protein n=2 Tax=Cyanophyceae TaxID=3028117 RepID=A0A4Q7E9D0_9CYAN|nr:hypothetical protein [Leptolyngbya sp. LK]RZM79009.1 hypothetical protein DYY88_09555 [Leptolyngbya sp. LK]
MFKPSLLCPFAICGRLIILLALWAIFLVGANDLRRAADGEQSLYEDIKRLAVYSLVFKREP